MKDKTNTFNLCCGALMTAMICIMTMVIQIPIPIGYVHLGDAFILLAALLLNRREAMLAAGLGSALADFLTGYVQWSVPTFFIKALIALIAGFFFYNKEGNRENSGFQILGLQGLRFFLGAVLSMSWMVVGYVFFGSILYGSVVTGLASAPGLIAKAVVNIAVYYVLAGFLEKAHVRRLIGARQ